MPQLYNAIIEHQSDKLAMQNIFSEMTMEKMKMDKFFSMFLNKFGSEMNPSKPDTPIWKLYNAKSNEYNELNKSIRTVEYLLKK